MFRVDAQADLHVSRLCPGKETILLGRAVEDHMVGQGQDFVDVAVLVGGAEGGDLAAVFLAPQTRFVDAGGAGAAEVLAL